jgi:16S rRNA (guanine966-N2)-methyltransferase
MRVIAGRLGGRRLRGVSKKKIRPTSDRVKTAIFNILPRDLSGARVLDLFAGSGSLGIEALSRGAKEAVFVDQGRESFRLIKDNLRELGLMKEGRLLSKKAGPAMKELGSERARFDLVFMDPPYNGALADKTLSLLGSLDVLEPGGIVVVEHARDERINQAYPGLLLKDQRRYGDTLVSFFETTEKKAETGMNSEGSAGPEKDVIGGREVV